MTYKRKRRHATKLPHYQIADIKPLGHNPEIEKHLRFNEVWQQARYKLEEVYYYVEDDQRRRKHFYAAGWLNELGHWQVAAPNFTGSLGLPALTVFPGADTEAWLFATMFEYLRHPQTEGSRATMIILNHPGLLQAGLAKAKAYKIQRTFFNNPLPVF